MTLISFCIPCYRSAMTIGAVIDEIKAVVGQKENYDYEIVAAVDGSPDNVFQVLETIAATDKKVKVVNLSKNYGQSSARMAALKFASGEYTVCLDDDGQCPMDKLWDLLEPIEKDGKDVSIAKYPQKKQSKFKNFGSWVNRKMTQILLEVPKDFDITNFIIMKKYVVDQILKYDNPYPYLTGLIVQITTNLAYVEMEERDRQYGTTTYTFKKMLSLWMNGFTNFSIKPLRIADILGIICAIFGLCFGAYIVIRKLINPDILVGYSSIVASIFFIGGIIMIMLGLIGEYIGRIFICINKSPQYVVKQILNISIKEREIFMEDHTWKEN